jgi:hypothetical protein
MRVSRDAKQLIFKPFATAQRVARIVQISCAWAFSTP